MPESAVTRRPEYERVVAELLVLQPQLVIVGLLPANDLSGAYQSVNEEGRFGVLKSSEQATLRALAAAKSQRPWPREAAATPGPEEAATATALVESSAVYRVVRSCADLLTDRTPFRRVQGELVRRFSAPPRTIRLRPPRACAHGLSPGGD